MGKAATIPDFIRSMGKILFIRGGAVGDFILTLPAIRLVRENLPEAEIEVLGYPPTNRLAQASGLVDATCSMEYGPLASFFIPNGALPDELVGYFSRFSVVFSYLYDPDGYFEANLQRSGVRTLLVGPYRVDESLTDRPAAAQLAKPLESLALYLEEPYVRLDFDGDSTEAAFRALPELLDESLTWIALHPGSGSPRKNWSFEGWVETAATLAASDPTIRFLVTSGEAEESVIGQFITLLTGRGIPHNRASYLPLPVLGVLLQRCRLYLGHDSGISHLAASCGVPCVLLFGKTNPAIWAPQNPGTDTIQAPEGDLSRIRVDEVLKRALAKLGEAREKSSSPP